MPLINDSDLCDDGVFINRVKMALVSTALAVQAESSAAANHQARSAYAIALLADPLNYARRMCPGMTVDGSLTGSSTVVQLETRASSIFNAYCVQS